MTLQFPNRLVGVVLDRFGREADVRPMTDRVFKIRVRVAVSGQFFGWLAGIGREAVVVSPVSVREQYQRWLTDIVNTMQLAEGLPERASKFIPNFRCLFCTFFSDVRVDNPDILFYTIS